MALATRQQTLPRSARLQRAEDFAATLRSPERSTDPYFRMNMLANARRGARLGMAVSLSAAGSAVSRNRIKRAIRESFRSVRSELPALDIVVVARPAVRAATTEQIRASLVAHWRKIARRCESS